MIVVGIAGKMKVGKTTLANHMVEMGATRRAFADALKDEVTARYLIDPHDKDKVLVWANMAFPTLEPPKPPWDVFTVRQLLQWYGTDFRRAQAPDYWVSQFAIWAQLHRPKVLVIDDVRFLNEVEWIKSQPNHLLVKLLPHSQWMEPEIGRGHSSETQLDQYNKWDAIYDPRGLSEQMAMWDFVTDIYKEIGGIVCESLSNRTK